MILDMLCDVLTHVLTDIIAYMLWWYPEKSRKKIRNILVGPVLQLLIINKNVLSKRCNLKDQIKDHSFSTSAKFSGRLTFFNP